MLRGSLALAVAGILAMSALPEVASGQWRTTEWIVTCSPELAVAFGPAYCFGDAPPAPPEVGSVRWVLEDSSRWLEGLGFPEPRVAERGVGSLPVSHAIWLRRRDPRCQVYLCMELARLRGAVASYMDPSGQIRLNAAQDVDGVLHPLERPVGAAEVHELFHAITSPVLWDNRGYSAIHSVPGAQRRFGWFVEGQPELVRLRWEERPLQSLDRDLATLDRRTYDQPLHLPLNSYSSSGWSAWAYGSWEFWDFLAEGLPGRDGLEAVHRFWELLPMHPLDTNGLTILDDALRDLGTGGFTDVYMEFVRSRLTTPCHFSGFGGQWVGAHPTHQRCEAPAPPWALLRSFQGEDSIRVEVPRRMVATRALRVEVEVPEGKIGRLSIRVPTSASSPDLHLVVDSLRVDRVDPATGLFPHGPRNVYRALIPPGRDEFFVRLANIPEDLSTAAEGTQFDQLPAAELDLVFRYEEAEVTVTGAVNVRMDAEAYVAYHPRSMDPVAVARGAAAGLIDTHTMTFPDTDEGRAAREEIRQAIEGALGEFGETDRPTGGGSGSSACMVLVTVFDDALRSLVQIGWEGAGPFLGRSHQGVSMGLLHNARDVVYGGFKNALQAQRIVEDPAAQDAFRGWISGTVPLSFRDALASTLRETTDTEAAQGMRGMLRALAGGALGPGRGTPLPSRDLPRSDDEFADAFEGQGDLEIHRHGDLLTGAFRFTGQPLHPDVTEPVQVEGSFTSAIGPLLDEILQQGCEGVEDDIDGGRPEVRGGGGPDILPVAEGGADPESGPEDEAADDRFVVHEGLTDPPEEGEAAIVQAWLAHEEERFARVGRGLPGDLRLSFPGAPALLPGPGAMVAEAQPVVGVLDADGAVVEGGAYAMSLRLDPARLEACNFPVPTRRFLFGLLSGEAALVGSIRVEVDLTREVLFVEFIQGQGDGYVLSMGGERGMGDPWPQGSGELRAALQRGWLGVFPPGGEGVVRCPGAVDLELLLIDEAGRGSDSG